MRPGFPKTGLRISENAARTLLFISRGLVEVFPATCAVLSSGVIGYRQAQKIVEHGYCVTEDKRAAVDTAEPEKMSERHLRAALMRSV